MSNPLFNNNINQMANMYKGMSNPIAMLSQMAMTNPQLQPILGMLKNGTSPEQIARSIMQQRGINQEEFINNLRRNMK